MSRHRNLARNGRTDREEGEVDGAVARRERGVPATNDGVFLERVAFDKARLAVLDVLLHLRILVEYGG